MSGSPDISVLMPVFNEAGRIEAALAAVAASLPGIAKEIVVVDDGSTDATGERLRHVAGTLRDDVTLKVIAHPQNRGKGAALRTALAAASAAVLVVQDADLEYDPDDWAGMYELIAGKRVADVVYGSRFHGSAHRSLYYHHYLGNRLLSRLFNVLYNQTLTDIEVCTKMVTRDVAKSLSLTADDFGVEIQMSAQIALARRWRIYETGIRYYGRTYAEGKKIRWTDGVKALGLLVRYRVTGGR